MHPAWRERTWFSRTIEFFNAHDGTRDRKKEAAIYHKLFFYNRLN
jgi:hypothetical protein